ncbi:phosphonate ABC transporter, permease protein PhnE [Microbacterium sp. LRZ72]|uniref:phosphonate ABC transporter, permease protein PhnE n=1 Tax=Microbacterium sp. LRZ72 TaxID=2942481 RepID=UPI0029B048E1|nr:phosphonate ABC transporter, permease protein PhnE [Microbacterium sp. LRZ72]MDX2375864.1 phosphonate ABC transporter, permease protein PhnE [Microbacterium sp. LRZ72]
MSGSTTPAASTTARPTKPRPRPFFIVTGIVAVFMTIWSAAQIDFTLEPLFVGNPRAWDIIAAYLSPNWSFLFRVWDAWVETIVMAILATLAGSAVGLVFALLASRATNRSPWFVRLVRWFLSVLRSLPEIGYAYLMVALVSTGTLAGFLALAIFNVGIIAKLTSETIDAVDRGPLEAADAAGATSVQRSISAVLPQIWPGYFSYVLYVFELNLRASAIMGLVGAGGIGAVIAVERARFNYDNVSALIVGLIVIVIALDIVSRIVRKRVL